MCNNSNTPIGKQNEWFSGLTFTTPYRKGNLSSANAATFAGYVIHMCNWIDRIFLCCLMLVPNRPWLGKAYAKYDFLIFLSIMQHISFHPHRSISKYFGCFATHSIITKIWITWRECNTSKQWIVATISPNWHRNDNHQKWTVRFSFIFIISYFYHLSLLFWSIQQFISWVIHSDQLT